MQLSAMTSLGKPPIACLGVRAISGSHVGLELVFVLIHGLLGGTRGRDEWQRCWASSALEARLLLLLSRGPRVPSVATVHPPILQHVSPASWVDLPPVLKSASPHAPGECPAPLILI